MGCPVAEETFTFGDARDRAVDGKIFRANTSLINVIPLPVSQSPLQRLPFRVISVIGRLVEGFRSTKFRERGGTCSFPEFSLNEECESLHHRYFRSSKRPLPFRVCPISSFALKTSALAHGHSFRNLFLSVSSS